MQHRNFAFDTHPFEGALTEALVESGELAPQLLTQRQELAPRFADYYSHLCRLPRRARRALQRQWKRSLAAIALLLALGQAPALAATIPVTPGTPPAITPDGRCSLIEAMENANGGAIHADCVAGAAGADTIILPSGSIQSLAEAHNTAYGGTGLPLVASEITIQGNGSTITGVPYPSLGDFRVLAVGAAGKLTLNNCKITRGSTDFCCGGGIANHGTLTLNSSTVSDNYEMTAGGIFNRGTLTLNQSTVSDNGAFYTGGVANYGTLTLNESTISENGSRFVGGVRSEGTLTLTKSTVSGNYATRYVGGLGIYEGTATLTKSTVSGNTVGDFGFGAQVGGVHNRGTLTLTNSTVSGNTTEESFAGPGYLAVGGVRNSDNGTLTLTNSTVSGNKSAFGSGGLLNSGKVLLARNLVSGNTGPNGAEINHDPSTGTVTANNFNLFGHSGDSGVGGFIPGANDLVPVEALNAILAALSNNGGATKTHALVAGSPALDAVEAGCPPPATDQRGEVRPRDGDGDGTALCDSGAFERTVAESSCGGGPTSGCRVNGTPDQLCLGTPGPDVIRGNNANNVIQGLEGNDSIRGGEGNDVICGDAGRDDLFGEKGEDKLFGGLGNDILRGGNDNDQLSGNRGKDKLFGENGNDQLDGGQDPDTCNGGAGSGDSAVSCETVLNVP